MSGSALAASVSTTAILAEVAEGDPGPAAGFDPTAVSRLTGGDVVLNPLAADGSATVSCPAGSIAISGGGSLEAGAEDAQPHVARAGA